MKKTAKVNGKSKTESAMDMMDLADAFDNVMLPRIEESFRKSANEAAIEAAIKGEPVTHPDITEYIVKESARRALTESKTRALMSCFNEENFK